MQEQPVPERRKPLFPLKIKLQPKLIQPPPLQWKETRVVVNRRETIYIKPKPPEQRNDNAAPRMVVSWFGWEIEHLELISDERFEDWFKRIHGLAAVRGWAVERLGNAIDLIIGQQGRSITPIEFFAFQADWDTLNAHFDMRMSGWLMLMGEDHQYFPEAPYELYVKGRKRCGDSIGRPARHKPKRNPGSRKLEADTLLPSRARP